MKGLRLLKTVELKDWIVVFPNAKKNAALMFINMYSDVIRQMGIAAMKPKE
jgi:hypothetical protein